MATLRRGNPTRRYGVTILWYILTRKVAGDRLLQAPPTLVLIQLIFSGLVPFVVSLNIL